MSTYVAAGLGIGALVSCIIAFSTGGAAIAEYKKGTKISDNPLKGEVISAFVFCYLCMCLLFIAKKMFLG
jgi:hypothetical protein